MTIDTCNNRKEGQACITKNSMSNLTADSENENYPIDNVLDEHPKRKWKAASVGESTVQFSTASGNNCLAIFNTNATKAVITLTDPNGVEWEAGVEWSNVDFAGEHELTTLQQGDSFSLWVDFNNTNSTISVSIKLTTTVAEPVEVGIIRCGISNNIGVNPLRGVREGLIDYSIVKPLSNGAEFLKKRDIVRTFSGRLYLDRDRDFYNYMYAIAREVGQEPIAWKITDLNLSDWTVFGKLNAMPNGSHDDPSKTNISFNIREVL